MTITVSRRAVAVLAAAVLVTAVPLLGATDALASAAGSGSLQPLENGLAFIQQFLSGAFGRTVAIIAVIICGYLALAGRITWLMCGSVVVAIALMFGAPTIVTAIETAVR